MSCRLISRLLLFIGLIFVGAFGLRAQGVVWTGPMMGFTNLAGSDWSLAANQDRLTDDVWLTRAGKKGIFNAAPGLESSYQSSSPQGTEWAVGALVDYASLSYTNWSACFGGAGNLLFNITATNAVVHLINSDIYISVTFTSWGGSSGGFSYQRSTPLLAVPEPGSETLACLAVTLVAISRRGRKNKISCSAS